MSIFFINPSAAAKGVFVKPKKYFLFGDLHGQNQHSCDETQQCDYFNYQFTHVETYNTSCTTIGPMLIYWLTYNRDHSIPTSFLLEESKVEKNKKRTYYNTYNKVMAKRQKERVNVLSTIFPFNDMSWMALTASILQPCFSSSAVAKGAFVSSSAATCQFSPISFHAVDIRALDGERVSPFALNFIADAIEDNITIPLRDVIHIVTTLFNQYDTLLMSLMDVNGYATLVSIFQSIITPLSKSTKSLYKKQWELMSPMFPVKHGVKIHRTAAALNKLNDTLSTHIKSFILDLAKTAMVNVIPTWYEYIDKYQDTTNQQETIQLFLGFAMNHFTVLSAYMMDAYVLAKMFLAEGEEIIVYTGAYHIEVYTLFLKQFIQPVIETATYEHQKCLYLPTLYQVLPLNTYRDYYYTF